MAVTEFRPHTLVEASDKAREYEHGTPERYYWNGVVLGFLAARDGEAWMDKYAEVVNSDWLAQPLPMGQALNLGNLANVARRDRESRFYNVAGALWGYKEATAHLPDADECTSCDRRILTSTDIDWTDCPNHGVVHDECRPLLCGTRGSCYEGMEP